MSSLANLLASLPEAERTALLASMTPELLAELNYNWQFWARPEQLPPEGEWLIWMIICGRSWGKTRTGSEWIRSCVCGDTPLTSGPRNDRYIALLAETAGDARDVLVEGPAGILACHPKDHRPNFEPSKRRLTWPNGAIATLYNGTEPDQLRGPQHSIAWIDEIAKYRYISETWDMLQFGLRLGTKPRQLITTTPRPLRLLRDLMEDPRTHLTRGVTADNAANLPTEFINSVYERYAGTRLGRQELEGEFLDDVPGALWTRKTFDEHRVKKFGDLPAMKRMIVSIDPAAKASGDTDETAETGIIVAGLGDDGRGYLIDDISCREGPAGWAKMAIAGYDRYECDAICAEVNNGGDMIETVIRNYRPEIKVIKVHASIWKITRAEPVSALYEQGKISHLGSLPILEDQMVMFTANGIMGGSLADRTDAAVHALTELMLKGQGVIRTPPQTRRTMPSHVGRSRFTGY